VAAHAPGTRGLDGLIPDGEHHGELARTGEAAPSSAGPRGREPRPPKPASRLATFLGAVSLGFGVLGFMVGLTPWIGAFLAAGPVLFSALSAWGSFVRSRIRAARVSGLAIAGVAVSVLCVVTLLVR
jgi:hypothetical protein